MAERLSFIGVGIEELRKKLVGKAIRIFNKGVGCPDLDQIDIVKSIEPPDVSDIGLALQRIAELLFFCVGVFDKRLLAVFPETQITVLDSVKASEIDFEQAKAMFMGHEVWLHQRGSSYRFEVESVLLNEDPKSPIAPGFIMPVEFKFWFKQKNEVKEGRPYVPIEADDILAVIE